MEIPIKHFIDSDHKCTVIGDACLNGCGAFCDNLQLWYYIPWPQHVIDRALKNKERNHSETVHINYLEHVVILISCNEVLDAIEQLGFYVDISHPKALIKADNTTTDAWTRKIESMYIIGKKLSRIFCTTLMNQELGVDSRCIAADDNHCADAVSRISKGSFFLFQNYSRLIKN